MTKRTKGGRVLGNGLDPQKAQLPLPDREIFAARLRRTLVDGQPMPFEMIAEKLAERFPKEGKMSSQAIQEMVRRARRKAKRLGSKERYRDNPGQCPIDELPLPARVRRALAKAGLTRLEQAARLTVAQVSELKGLGKDSLEQFQELVRDWGVGAPDLFCMLCGSGMDFGETEKTITCPSCSLRYEVMRWVGAGFKFTTVFAFERLTAEEARLEGMDV